MHKFIFLFNNQPDALFIQIYSAIILYMFRATSLSIIRSLLLYILHWSVSYRMELMSSILTLLGNGHHNLPETDQCRMYSSETPDDGQRSSPKHVGFLDRINLDKECVWLVSKKKSVTRHGNMNVKCINS